MILPGSINKLKFFKIIISFLSGYEKLIFLNSIFPLGLFNIIPEFSFELINGFLSNISNT
jgi:hypothetical protein